MRVLHLLPHLVLLVLREGRRASWVAHGVLKAGGCILGIEAVVFGVPMVHLGIVKHVTVGDAIALVDAIKIRGAASNHGDLAFYKLTIGNMTQVVAVAERLKRFDNRIQRLGVRCLKVNEQRNGLRWL